MRFIPALEASTGSLGNGLSLALGMGCAARLDGAAWRTYVMLGDGEIQEGQIWEAAMFGAFHKLDNVCAIVDYNRIQLDGFVKDIMEVEPLADKWRAFGWHVVEIDGHDIAQIQAAFAEAAATKGKPTVLIAHTVKGKGVSFMENNPKFHGVAPIARRSATRPSGAPVMPAKTKFELKMRNGHARGVRQDAGRSWAARTRTSWCATRTCPSPP